MRRPPARPRRAEDLPRGMAAADPRLPARSRSPAGQPDEQRQWRRDAAPEMGPVRAMFVYAGSLTADRAQQGIFVYTLDPATGALDLVQRNEIASPGFLAFSPDRTRLYAASRGNTVDGGEHDLAVAYAIDRQSGRLELLDTTPIPPDPAYVAIDRTGSLAAFACTFGGATAAVRIDSDGKFAGPAQVIPHHGRSLSSQGITPW